MRKNQFRRDYDYYTWYAMQWQSIQIIQNIRSAFAIFIDSVLTKKNYVQINNSD